MVKARAILLIGAPLTASLVFCLADKKNHICFRALNSNKYGMVTVEELERCYDSPEEKFKYADLEKDGKLAHDKHHSTLWSMAHRRKGRSVLSKAVQHLV